MQKSAASAYNYYHEPHEQDVFHQEVIAGLNQRLRSIPPKYFYDHAGSSLFESICEQPEYYPTRTEITLLKQYAGDIADMAGTGCYLVEPGSGSCEKVRHLLETLRPVAYVPLDISCKHLDKAAAGIAMDFPWLNVHAVCTDITDDVSLPFVPAQAPTVMFYPGSSIGNFDPDEARSFLACLATIAGQGGGLLIGVDLKKDRATLDAAYNDRNGVTAAFNQNVLHRINRELNADFEVSSFEHHAFYNPVKSRVEMHLICDRKQTVNINDHCFEFKAGDSIHTESSYKYTVEEFQALAASAGFAPGQVWCDADGLFSLHYLHVD